MFSNKDTALKYNIVIITIDFYFDIDSCKMYWQLLFWFINAFSLIIEEVNIGILMTTYFKIVIWIFCVFLCV